VAVQDASGDPHGLPPGRGSEQRPHLQPLHLGAHGVVGDGASVARRRVQHSGQDVDVADGVDEEVRPA